MDITQVFKACVKTVRVKNKSLKKTELNVTKIISSTEELNEKPDFATKIKGICYQITQLRDFLIENRAAYMKFAYHLKRYAQMSDEERDLIDRESETIINICGGLVKQFKAELGNYKFKKQERDHMDNLVKLLECYLESVNKIYTEQKEYRIHRDIESYKFLKLESDKKRIHATPPAEPIPEMDHELVESYHTTTDGLRHRKTTIPSKLSMDDEMTVTQPTYNNDVEELSNEDIQMFESENVQLFNELKGLSEEVEQIEKNVVDIAKLQEIFTEKVTLQKHDIDRIANTVVGATENVRDANEHIKQAIQRNAGLRVYILFFLIVMSFSLLFLDWYND